MQCPELVGTLVSIQIARPQTYGDGADSWTSSIFKRPVEGPLAVSLLGIDGDQPADTKHHGGVDKAILGYSADHRSFWKQELGTDVLGGGFGENLTIEGIDETAICIGDRWLVGNVVLEVSQPRQPCWKLGRRWNRKDLPKLVVQNGRSGWYFRVLRAGTISAGQLVTLTDRPHPDWSIVRASKAYYGANAGEKASLARLDRLAEVWKRDLLHDGQSSGR